MSEFTESIRRAIHQRQERAAVDTTALVALSKMVAQAKAETYRRWVAELGELEADLLWREHFGDERHD